MRKVGTTEYAEILFELTNNKSEAEVQKSLQVFTVYLAKQKALGKIAEIQKAYERLMDGKEGRVRVLLTTPEKLDIQTMTEVKQAIEKSFEAASVDLEEKIDTTLIGGWKARTDNYLIDASIRGRLNRLKMILTK